MRLRRSQVKDHTNKIQNDLPPSVNREAEDAGNAKQAQLIRRRNP